MYIEVTQDETTGEDVLLFYQEGKYYLLPKDIKRLNSVLADSPSRKQLQSMRLAIKLEQQAHQETQQRLTELQEQINNLDYNYQIAINTILAIQDGLPTKSISTIVSQLRPRRLVLD